MRIDCHTHSALFSACSRTDPDTLCSLAVERGLDGLVLTEHHTVWPRKMLADLAERHAPLRLYSGVELSLAERYDIVCINPPAGFSPTSYMPFDELAAELAPVRDSVFLFVAHPFRYTEQVTPALERLLAQVDGVEVNSVNILRAGFSRRRGKYEPTARELYRWAWKEWSLTAVFNTDTHMPESVAAVANELNGHPPETSADLAAVLRRTQPVEHQDAGLLSSALARFV